MSLHLVTGGSGFVGSNLARLLHERGESVRILDIWRDPAMPEGIEFAHADINDEEGVEAAMRGVDYVHHNVALVPLAKAGKQFWTVNVDGTRTALKAAERAKVKMFSHMSSSAVFGRHDVMPITNDTPRTPVEIYGRAKLAAEELAMRAGEEGLPVSIVRPRTTIGPGRLGIFTILFDWIRDDANVIIIGSGDNLLQFVHVDDLCEVSIQCCLQERAGVYNAGAEVFGTLRGDLTALIRHAGKKGQVKGVPPWLAVGSLALLDRLRLSPLGPYHYLTYFKSFYFDIEPVKSALSWRPKYSNQEILNSTYDWFVAQGQSEKPVAGAIHKSFVKQGALGMLKRLA
jgi:nucleoside-diphosphate-sugar epimerase